MTPRPRRNASCESAPLFPYKAYFTKQVPGQSPVARSDNTQFGIYLQDDWALTRKLTFNLGVRWDYEKTPAYLDHVTPANVIAAINSQDPFAPIGQTYARGAPTTVICSTICSWSRLLAAPCGSPGRRRSAQNGRWQPRFLTMT